MNFIYPYWLYGLFAILIPVVIHFFNLQRPKKVYFTNVRLLKEAQQEASQKLKIKHWLILLSRILFITFLVLAFAQPFIPGKNQGLTSGRQLVSIYIDNSFSMENQVGETSALSNAVQSVNKLINLFSPDTRYHLITNDFSGEDRYFMSGSELKDRITELDYSNMYRKGRDVLNRQENIIENHNKDFETHVFWFSDFQKSTMGPLKDLNFDSTRNYYLAPVKSPDVNNVFVDSIWLDDPFVKTLENNELNLKVSNSGNKEVKDLVLHLSIDGAQVSSAGVDIPANNSIKTSFNFTLESEGAKKARITFDDYPVSFDNQYYFTLKPTPEINVYYIRPDNLSYSYIPHLFNDNKLFNFSRSGIANIDYQRLQSADLLVINGLKKIPQSLHKNIKKITEKGGGVAIFPSGKGEPSSYKAAGNALGFPLMDIKKPDSVKPSPSLRLSTPDTRNPFFSDVFEGKQENISMPYGAKIMDWGNTGETILQYKDNSPFISAFPVQNGNIYLVRSALGPEYSNFGKHALFVPVLYKMAIQSIPADNRLAYDFQEKTISLKVDEIARDRIYTLKKGNFELRPAQRFQGKKLFMELPDQKMDAGFYKLTFNEESKKTLAFNYGKKESRMEFYSSEALGGLVSGAPNVDLFEEMNPNAFYKDFKERNVGVPLWKYCIILALISLLLEIAVIRLMKKA